MSVPSPLPPRPMVLDLTLGVAPTRSTLSVLLETPEGRGLLTKALSRKGGHGHH
jgi:hypothetical protein